jgi:hypothetical protein
MGAMARAETVQAAVIPANVAIRKWRGFFIVCALRELIGLRPWCHLKGRGG